MSEPSPANLKDHSQPPSPGETDPKTRTESDPGTGTGDDNQPKSSGSLDVKLV